MEQLITDYGTIIFTLISAGFFVYFQTRELKTRVEKLENKHDDFVCQLGTKLGQRDMDELNRKIGELSEKIDKIFFMMLQQKTDKE